MKKIKKLIKLNLLMAIGYILLSKLAWSLAIDPGNVTAFWPASGWALGLMLRTFNSALWPGVFIGNFLSNTPLFIDTSSWQTILNGLITGVGIGIGDTLQTVCAFLIIKKIFFNSTFKGYLTVKSLWVVIFAISGTHLMSPSFGVLSLLLGGYLEEGVASYTWLTWYTGDLLGALILTPLIVFTKQKFFREIKLKKAFFTLTLPVLTLFILHIYESPYYLIYLFPLIVFIPLTMEREYSFLAVSLMVFFSIFALSMKLNLAVELNNYLLSFQSIIFIFVYVIGFILVVIDEKQFLENELNNQRVLSFHQARLVSLGEMSAGLAHELNNPLAIISLGLRVIDKEIKGGGDKEKLTTSISLSNEAIERCSKIVSGLKIFSRQEHTKKESLSLLEVIKSSVELINMTLTAQDVEVKVNDLNSTDLKIYCNKVEFEQVLINLLQNAIHVCKDFPKADRVIKILVESEDKKVRVRVIDPGAGISNEIKSKLFNPFFTTKEVGVGTGLGLSISSGIIDALGGRLDYELFNGNTSFVIELPISKDY